MALQLIENLDFSGLFKLDVLLHLDISTYSYYEVGLKKFFAFSGDKELHLLFMNAQSERLENNYDWDFVDNPIFCMCFEPSGTWLIIVSEQKVLLVPFLPLFIPQNTFDHKWSLSCVTVLPLAVIPLPISVVCWLTKESESVLIIGSKTGTISFYSLDSQSIVGDCKVSGEITELQICFDDSLDLLALLISGGKNRQWKLVLEHRSYGYNWLQQTRAQNDKEKRDSFMSYIRQFSKDKITLFIQGGSKDDRTRTVEYVLKPVEYIPQFRKGSNNWALTAQYVNGRHFLTAFELNEGTLILESPDEDTAPRTLRPRIKKDDSYIQGLWSQKLVYLLRKNDLEIHSASFSVIQGEGLLGTKREFSQLWNAELIGEVRRAHLMSVKEPASTNGGWREPTFMCDLQLPRFALESCLVITSCGAYILNTVSEPCEWLVGLIMRGGAGAELSAAALGAPVGTLLRAAADMLMSRGKLAPAQYLFSLSQSQPDGWVARLGVFGRIHELSMYKYVGNAGGLGTSAITIQLMALLLKMATNDEQRFDTDVKFTSLSPTELLELSSFAAAAGLWALVPVFSIHRGHPHLLLAAIKSRGAICRGAINCLLQHRCLVPLLLEENGQWLFDFIVDSCDSFDTIILKCICLWLNPLQDQLRPVMRDLKQGLTSIYTTRMLNLISTFIRVASTVESREPCPEIHHEMQQDSETWKSQFIPKRALSCGLAHWAVADEGRAKVMMTNTPINTEAIGRVMDVACGRHHTLILTENGLYASGDNTFGQLGVGRAWRGGVGEAAAAGGAVLAASLVDAPVHSLAAGHYHSAAIDNGGRLYTWGWGVHGQLGLGSIDDQWTPQLVTKFQGRKVVTVGCGACHTVVLMANGEVWAMGAGVFGQLGSGARDKSSTPLRVRVDYVESIAVGYFHNLALTNKGQLYVWGASPQQVRATAARRNQSEAATPSSPSALAEIPCDSHLTPRLVDTCNVRSTIVQISAGWHHSCIMTDTGTFYTWGLNFDGQLGSGDRKQIFIPTEVKIRVDSQPDTVSNNARTPEGGGSIKTKALVGCGGDFTIYMDDDGRIYATGNSHLQCNNEKEKGTNRVIMMKTTKRVIKIPAAKTNNKFLFQPIDRIDIMFPFDIDGSERNPLEPRVNPLSSMKDFKKKSWADNLIMILKPWLDQEQINNPNMAAKLAYHNQMYADCLKYLLDNLQRAPEDDKNYLAHCAYQDETKDKPSMLKDDEKITLTNIMSKRIKEASLAILNEEPYPAVDASSYRLLPCGCDEIRYIKKSVSLKSDVRITDSDKSAKAADIIDKCITMFPINNELWETCFRLSKNFYLDNNLSISALEKILFKYMETNANTTAAAIMYSNDCAQYCEILSPKLYLNMCSQIMDTWG